MATHPVDEAGVDVATPLSGSLPSNDFGDLFRLHFGESVRLAGLMGADDPENVAQEAFARLHLRFDRFPTRQEATAYLRAIVCNLSRSNARRSALARRLRPRMILVSGSDDVSTVVSDADSVGSALAHLPKRQREVIVLRYWLGLPQAEIASVLGISVGSVKTHTHRAMAALARDLRTPTGAPPMTDAPDAGSQEDR